MQPPTQELIVRDLHDNTWTFRHIYRGETCKQTLILIQKRYAILVTKKI